MHTGHRATPWGSILVLLLALALPGCVVVPYRPDADTTHDTTAVPEPERVRLTIGPREFLDDLAHDVLKKDRRLQRADSQSFIDIASPDADLTLARLLDPDTRARIAPLGVDYLIVVGEPVDATLDKKGEVVMYGGFLGLASEKGSSTDWAAVIDLRELRQVEKLTSTATGTSLGAGFFYGLFILSDTQGAARSDLIEHLVQTLAAARPEGAVRLAFVAAEHIPTAEEETARRERQRPPLPPPWASEQYPAFVEESLPVAGFGQVYLFRDVRDGGFGGVPVGLRRGGRDAAETGLANPEPGTYFVWAEPAGQISLHLAGAEAEFLDLEIRPGEREFVRVDGHIGWYAPRFELVQVDEQKALRMLRKCRRLPPAGEAAQDTLRLAEQGYPEKQFELGGLYARGVSWPDGRPSLALDPVEAYRWYTIAAHSAYYENIAIQMRELQSRGMSSAEIAEGERRAREWIAAHPNLVERAE